MEAKRGVTKKNRGSRGLHGEKCECLTDAPELPQETFVSQSI